MMQTQVLLNAVPNEIGVQNSVLSSSGKKGGVGSETGSNAFQEKLGEKLKDCESPVEHVPSDEQQVVQPMLKEDGGTEKSNSKEALASEKAVSKNKGEKQADKTPVAQETTNGKEKLNPENTRTIPDRSIPQLKRNMNAVQAPEAAAKDAPQINSETVPAQKQAKSVQTIVTAEAKTTTVANAHNVSSVSPEKVVATKPVVQAEAKPVVQTDAKPIVQAEAKTATAANSTSFTNLPLEVAVKLKQANAGNPANIAQPQAMTAKTVASEVPEARTQVQQQTATNVISIASKGSVNLVNQEMSPAQQKMQMLTSMDRSANPIGMTFEAGFQKSTADEPIVTFKQQQQSLFATSMNEPRFHRQNIMESANVQAVSADKQMGNTKKTTKRVDRSSQERPVEVREVKQGESATKNSVNTTQSSKPADSVRAAMQTPVFSDNSQTITGGEKDPGFAGVMQKSETQVAMPESTTQARQSFVQNHSVRIVEQAQSQLLKQAKLGGGKVTMTLHPQSLGKLDVEIQIQSGTMKAFIMAEDPAVKEVLMQQQSQLKSALESQGLKLEEFSVSVREDNQFSGGGSRQAGERQNGASAGQDNGNAVEENPRETSSVRPGNQNALLDLIA